MFQPAGGASDTGFAMAITGPTRAVAIATCDTRKLNFVFPYGPVLSDKLLNTEDVGILSDVTTAELKYSTEQGERLRDQQPLYGSKEDGDHRGHILARALGGPPEPRNLFWQDSRINQGRMRVFETRIRETLTEHKTWTARLRIELLYYPRASCTNHLWRPTGLIYDVWYYNSRGVYKGHNQMKAQN
jgi:hypothetical protein